MESQLNELLSLLVITSAVRANPSTYVIDKVISSFKKVAGLSECQKYIICDGYRLSKDQKDSFKAGKISSESARNYEIYKTNLKVHAQSAEKNSEDPWKGVHIVELSENEGFSYAVKYALDNLITTPYILLIQHDRPFIQNFDLCSSLEMMENHPEVEYLGLKTKKTRHLMGGTGRQARFEGTKFSKGKLQVYQLWFWYDSNHICRASKYRRLFEQKYEDYISQEDEALFNTVFPHVEALEKSGNADKVGKEERRQLLQRPLVRRREFFEDTYGQLIHKHLPYALAARGSQHAEEVQALYGAYLLDTGLEDIVCHCDGRKYRTAKQTQEIISYNLRNKKFSNRGSSRFQSCACELLLDLSFCHNESTNNHDFESKQAVHTFKSCSCHQPYDSEFENTGMDIHIKSIWDESIVSIA